MSELVTKEGVSQYPNNEVCVVVETGVVFDTEADMCGDCDIANLAEETPRGFEGSVEVGGVGAEATEIVEDDKQCYLRGEEEEGGEEGYEGEEEGGEEEEEEEEEERERSMYKEELCTISLKGGGDKSYLHTIRRMTDRTEDTASISSINRGISRDSFPSGYPGDIDDVATDNAPDSDYPPPFSAPTGLHESNARHEEGDMSSLAMLAAVAVGVDGAPGAGLETGDVRGDIPASLPLRSTPSMTAGAEGAKEDASGAIPSDFPVPSTPSTEECKPSEAEETPVPSSMDAAGDTPSDFPVPSTPSMASVPGDAAGAIPSPFLFPVPSTPAMVKCKTGEAMETPVPSPSDVTDLSPGVLEGARSAVTSTATASGGFVVVLPAGGVEGGLEIEREAERENGKEEEEVELPLALDEVSGTICRVFY